MRQSFQRAAPAIFARAEPRSLVALEELHGPLVLLRFRSGAERSEIAAATSFWVGFP
jgi:hypothetical protein